MIKTDEGGWSTVAPSAIAYDQHYTMPVEMDASAIRKVVDDFKAATRRAMLAGFKVVEIHAAHGYLLHQFLSPLSNHRQDEYGGSFENRIRLLMEVVDVVRAGWPPVYPLFVRLSATDWAESGWSPDEAVRLAGVLKDRGVDLIDCSSGGLVPYQQIPVGPGYQVGFSRQIREATGILTSAIGIITDAVQAETILATGQADLIGMARQLLRDPYFPLHAADELRNKEIHWPVQYERARLK
jgi:2,4-dienoyl-CoA reductase-like NADH-dependent reductase (Old Yellow Enzyme family)